MAGRLRDQATGGGYHCTRWSKAYSGGGCARASQSGTASTGGSSPAGGPDRRGLSFRGRRTGYCRPLTSLQRTLAWRARLTALGRLAPRTRRVSTNWTPRRRPGATRASLPVLSRRPAQPLGEGGAAADTGTTVRDRKSNRTAAEVGGTVTPQESSSQGHSASRRGEMGSRPPSGKVPGELVASLDGARMQEMAGRLRDQATGGGYHCTRWSKAYSGGGCARASQSGTASPSGSSQVGDPRRRGRFADVGETPLHRRGLGEEGNAAHMPAGRQVSASQRCRPAAGQQTGARSAWPTGSAGVGSCLLPVRQDEPDIAVC